MQILKDLPLASLLSLVACVLAVYLVLSDEITLDDPEEFLQFMGGLGAVVAGFAALGKVRNDAGHGTR